MSTISTVLAREHFSEIINRSAYGKERVILRRRGKDIVAIIPLEDLKFLEAIEDEMDVADAKKILKKIKEEGTISLEKFKEDLEK